MKRLSSTIKWDFILIIRHNFHYAAGFVLLLWILILLQLKTNRDLFVAALLFLEMAIVGFYFIAALVLFEKGQLVLSGLIVTPLSSKDYLISKVTTFTLFALLMSLVLLLATLGINFHWGHAIGGVLLTSCLYNLLSFIAVSKFQSINDFFLVSVIYFAILNFPLLSFFDLTSGWLFYIFPSHGSLLLFKAAIRDVPIEQILYAYCYLLFSIAICYALAQHFFYKNIILRQGA